MSTLRLLPLASLLALTACPTPTPTSDAGPEGPSTPEAPELICPGADGCGSNDGELRAGAAVRAFTPTAFEIANPHYLKRRDSPKCQPGLPSPEMTACGELKIEIILDDCGRDAICPGAEDYVAPDADDSEGDGVTDYFEDCGRDRLCPGDEGYTGPDADGTEGDGLFQGLWIAGYGNNRPAMGVKDSIDARTIVLQTGDVTVAMTTIDAVGLFFDEVRRIRERVEAERPGAVDYVIVQSTHTHEAPDTMGQWGLEDPYAGLQLGHGRSDAMMEALRAAAAESIIDAYDQLAPASLAVGTVNTRIDGFLNDGRDPQIFNDLMTVVTVDHAQTGDAIATLVNWGNHPEILDSANNYISSDYAWAMREALENGLAATDTFEARAGRGGVAIYQQGTVGGLIGPNGFDFVGRDGVTYDNANKTWARCDAYGELLADQAFQAMASATPVAAPVALSVAAQTIEATIHNQVFHVGFFNGWFDRDLLGFNPDMPIEGDNLPFIVTEVALVQLGPIGWLTAPGELFPETWVGFAEAFQGPELIDPNNPNPPALDDAPTGPFLVERTGVTYPMLLGLAQDEIGYLVPPYDFELHPTAPWIDEAEGDHYEETNSIGPDALPTLMEGWDRLLYSFFGD
jgi:hypothetical protein